MPKHFLGECMPLQGTVWETLGDFQRLLVVLGEFGLFQCNPLCFPTQNWPRILTPNTPLIHTLFTCSKWNMDDWYGLKVSLIISTYITQNFLEIPPCAKNVIWITEFGIQWKNPPFSEVNLNSANKLCAWRNFKKQVNFWNVCWLLLPLLVNICQKSVVNLYTAQDNF